MLIFRRNFSQKYFPVNFPFFLADDADLSASPAVRAIQLAPAAAAPPDTAASTGTAAAAATAPPAAAVPRAARAVLGGRAAPGRVQRRRGDGAVGGGAQGLRVDAAPAQPQAVGGGGARVEGGGLEAAAAALRHHDQVGGRVASHCYFCTLVHRVRITHS